MRKVFLFSAVVFAFCLLTKTSFAAKVCLQDNVGGFWELKGGKVDKKTFTAKYIVPGACVLGGYADVTLTNSGTLVVSLYNSHSASANCNVVFWSASTNIFFGGSGEYDIVGDGSIDGTFSLTPVNCSTLPPSGPQRTVNPNNPAIRKQ